MGYIGVLLIAVTVILLLHQLWFAPLSKWYKVYRSQREILMPTEARRGRLKILINAKNKAEMIYLFRTYEKDTPFGRGDIIESLVEIASRYDTYSDLHDLLFEKLADFATLSKREAERIYFAHFVVWDIYDMNVLECILTVNTRNFVKRIDRRIKAPKS